MINYNLIGLPYDMIRLTHDRTIYTNDTIELIHDRIAWDCKNDILLPVL